MEKNRVRQKKRWRSGLLVSVCIAVFIFPAGAKTLSDSEIPALRLLPQDDMCFVGQEMTFTLDLPGIDSSLARTDVPDFSEGKTDARLVSARKSDFSDSDGDVGTRFQFQIAFSSAGIIVLPPLAVYINHRSYAIPFERVTVYEDPSTIEPELSIAFENKRLRSRKTQSQPLSVSVGETVYFTLYIRYCTQLLHFSWDLPKNAIFTEVERYDIARGEPQKKSFSPDMLPLARFSWKPLIEGSYAVPSFSVEAVAYNGARKMISLPPMTLSVSASQNIEEKNLSSSQRKGLFAQAFAPPERTGEETPTELMSPLDGQKKGSGRMLEPLQADRQRPVLFLAAAIACLLLSGALYLLRQKRKILPPLVISLVFLGGAIWTYVDSRSRYAIFSGGAVSVVPEESASSVMQVPAGTRVKIVEKAGDWVYIKSDDYAGWVKEKDK